MPDVIQLFGKGKTATLSEKKKRAYQFKGQCAHNIMIAAQENGVDIPDLIEPFMQFTATLVAAARMTGTQVDIEELMRQFPDEVSAMVKLMIEGAGRQGVTP